MKRQYIILTIIFILTVLFRLYYAFQTQNFDYDAYFNIRQVESIDSTGFPIFYDDLSFGGRTNVFLPTFHYVLALFGLFIPSFFLFKILPNLFAASSVFIAYLIAYRLTKNINISLLTAFICSFIPIFITETINNVSVYSLIVPLTLLLLYSLMNSNKKKFVYLYISIIILLALTSSFTFLLIVGLLFYLVLSRLEHIEQNQAEFEIILFSVLLVTWFEFIVFKNSFLSHGAFIVWQNIPSSILSKYFKSTTLFEMTFMIGIIPLVFGTYTIYNNLFVKKNKGIYLLMGFALSVFFALWLKFIEPPIGTTFFGIILTLLASQSFKDLISYLKKTKFSKYRKLFVLSFFIIFIIIYIVPIFYFTEATIRKAPTKIETDALLWLKENSNETDVIVASPDEGFLINALAKRKNVIDTNFMLIKNPGQVLDEVTTIYKTPYKIEALRFLNKYNVDYIILSKKTKEYFGITDVSYVSDEECFKLVYDNETKIYKSMCRIEEI